MLSEHEFWKQKKESEQTKKYKQKKEYSNSPEASLGLIFFSEQECTEPSGKEDHGPNFVLISPTLTSIN